MTDVTYWHFIGLFLTSKDWEGSFSRPLCSSQAMFFCLNLGKCLLLPSFLSTRKSTIGWISTKRFLLNLEALEESDHVLCLVQQVNSTRWIVFQLWYHMHAWIWHMHSQKEAGRWVTSENSDNYRKHDYQLREPQVKKRNKTCKENQLLNNNGLPSLLIPLKHLMALKSYHWPP